MKKGQFTYGLLQYHHSQLLGEVMNVGLLACFPDLNLIKFIYPEKLLRLRHAYIEIPEKAIKATFKQFEARCKELNKSLDFFSAYHIEQSFEDLVFNEFLIQDDSALQFGNIRTSVLYTTEVEHILNQLYNLYFSVFKYEDSYAGKIDEAKLLNHYKQLLTSYLTNDKELKNYAGLKTDYVIKPKSGDFHFDLAWKSANTTHLIQPISFDLVKEDSITNKAYRYWGEFSDLEEYAEENSYQFDVILAEPKGKGLIASYKNAVRILEKPKNVNLFDQKSIEKYAKQTAIELNA